MFLWMSIGWRARVGRSSIADCLSALVGVNVVHARCAARAPRRHLQHADRLARIGERPLLGLAGRRGRLVSLVECRREWLAQDVVELAGDEPLEAAEDLLLRESLGGSSLDVCLGAWVPAHPAEHDAVDGGFGLSVAATVEAMPRGCARGSRDRRDAAEHRYRALRASGVGLIVAIRGVISASRSTISARSAACRRPSMRSATLTACSGSPTAVRSGRRPAQTSSSRPSLSPRRRSRSLWGAVMIYVLMRRRQSARWATALRRTTRKFRSASTCPSRRFGRPVRTRLRTARAAASASIASDFPAARRVLRSGWSTSTTAWFCAAT